MRLRSVRVRETGLGLREVHDRDDEVAAATASWKKKPSTLTGKVLGSGDVLLSHGLSPYYHRDCSVSLPCSEWERVGPLRYCHQSAEPHWRFRCCRSEASAGPSLWRLGRLKSIAPT
jgi:hypothetical protein